ncbi:hypothetical protein HWV62_35981 [Athelia sp. TMB]|nr:hypothetical protein HWV62_35981 [Athelia sp. TMB]
MAAMPPNDYEERWIAIEPPGRPGQPSRAQSAIDLTDSDGPPTFRESQFDIILRRQRPAPGLKSTTIPSRFLNLSNEFEFAGWGTRTTLQLSPEDHENGQETLQNIASSKILGQIMGSGLAGNDILGGVFYTIPAVSAVAGV